MKLLYTFFLFFASNYLFSQQLDSSKNENELVQISKLFQVSDIQQLKEIKELLLKKEEFLKKEEKNKDEQLIQSFQYKLFLDVLAVLKLNERKLSSVEKVKLKEVLYFK